MFNYKPPTEVLDDTLRKAFVADHGMDARFSEILDQIRRKERRERRERDEREH